jgi:4-hydroxythreonine-4-phosphate dehydrogenase
MSSPKKIAITIGDPAGIGTEVVLKAIISHEIAGLCKPIIIGDIAVVEEAIEKLNIPVNLNNFKIINTGEIKSRNFQKCKPAAESGRACVSYIKKAVELVLNKEVDAIVTAPISKESLKMAGFKWPGHTEMLAEFTNTKDYAMLFYSDKLKLILATIHTALRNVPDLIKKEKVLKTIMLAKKACDMMGIENLRIAVAGLNPHAGEAGIFGDEEAKEIIPAINEAQTSGIFTSGPYPADTLFHKAYNGEFDIIVCMYHDQGLIPLKMIAFDKAVNVTIGLPIIRTSPDHGTAYDIAWKGIANPSSMIEAIKLAVKLRR